jgi:hypothetical protein
MTLGSKENYVNAAATKREASFHRLDLWWLLTSIREIYDMQANRRKATSFNMQKLVVNNYALGILVLKVTTTPQDSYFDRITESHRDRPTT